MFIDSEFKIYITLFSHPILYSENWNSCSIISKRFTFFQPRYCLLHVMFEYDRPRPSKVGLIIDEIVLKGSIE